MLEGDDSMGKIHVGILFGGKSAEHEVSLQSAKNVIAALDKDKYDITLIGIDKQGQWYLNDQSRFLLNAHDPKTIALDKSGKSVTLVPGSAGQPLMAVSDRSSVGPIDVVFPILHGTCGEDGTVQGLLKLANLPFVGAGVLGSAVGMDKDVMKRLLRDAGIPVAKFKVYHKWQRDQISFDDVAGELGLPMFVKPANLGSSVGVGKVKGKEDFFRAIDEAFKFDRKILIEEFIAGREVECSVLGNDHPMASAVGEIIAQQEFYSYEAKYIDENGAILEIPAKLSNDAAKRVQELAVESFRVLCCEGMARVDCFLTKDERVIVNEINTIPGFTKISMYPKLWEVSGLPYSKLIDRLIELALERHAKEQQLETCR